MTPRLTTEQREALQNADGPVPIEDAETQQTYFLVDAATVDAIQKQQDLKAIQRGIDDLEAGRVAPLDEVLTRIRGKLGVN